MTEEEELAALEVEKARRRENAKMLAAMKIQKIEEKQADELALVSDYAELLDKAEPRAVRALIEIAEKGTSESARVAAANALLDRKRGKPMQSIEQKSDGKLTIQIMQFAPPKVIDHDAIDVVI